MGTAEALRVGMGIADVCQTLMGWRCLEVRLIDDPAGGAGIVWEFVSRTGATRVHVLFHGGQLSAWHVLNQT